MPDLHLWASTGVARVRVVHTLRPLLACQNELALRALRIPAVLGLPGQREATGGHTRVDDAGLEDIRVRRREDVRHHGSGGRAHSEDAVGVDAPVGDRVARCRCDSE